MTTSCEKEEDEDPKLVEVKRQRRRRLAYDGRGNAVVASAGALAAAVEALGGYAHGLYAERWAPFTKARARPAAARS
jgi:phosphoribosylaminoimidazole carboxylase (NCAIR synthetase)